ncbi:hypothetical protein [Streptomyces yangpuensis]|uniref:hypothetical protein n=1 Tax=Streptomyces yangpuensis TaxID=1648182 RepID=UPI0036476EE1
MELNAENITALAAAVGGPVAVFAAWLGYRGGKAQAAAQVEGVQLQLNGEREFALWSAKRDAYASVLAAAEAFRVSFNHATRVTSMYLEERLGSAKAANDAEAELRQNLQALRLSQSSLRLSLNATESARVDDLTALATKVFEGFGDWTDALQQHQGDERAWARLKENHEQFSTSIHDWAEAAQSALAATSGVGGGPRP